MAELLGPGGGQGARLLDGYASRLEIEPRLREEARELARAEGQLEQEAHRRAGPARSPELREAGRVATGHGIEERAPGEEDCQPVGDARERARSVRQGEAAEERVGAGATGRGAKVVRHRVDAQEEDVGLERGALANEGPVSGPEIEVDRPESPGPLSQSSTVYPVFLPAFDDEHAGKDTGFARDAPRLVRRLRPERTSEERARP